VLPGARVERPATAPIAIAAPMPPARASVGITTAQPMVDARRPVDGAGGRADRTPRPLTVAQLVDGVGLAAEAGTGRAHRSAIMVFLNESIVNVALPSIKTDLGYSQAGLAWVVNA
jgi:hypothetical protein